METANGETTAYGLLKNPADFLLMVYNDKRRDPASSAG
jgi:hypothetical protein